MQFAKEQDEGIRKSIAASIHEAFSLIKPEEDSFKLRECYKTLLEDNSKEVLSVLSEHMD